MCKEDLFEQIVQEKERQYLVYHLINNKTLNRYFGYVPVDGKSKIIAVGKEEREYVINTLNNGEYLKNEKAIYKSIQDWGWENFSVKVIDYNTKEDVVKNIVKGLVERFEYYKQLDAYNDKEEVAEQERTEIDDRSNWMNNMIKTVSRMNANEIARQSHCCANELKGHKEKIPVAPYKSKLSNNTNAKVPIALIDKRTGEEVYFESKGDCMRFLNTNHVTFSKFLKGKTKKLNARYTPKKIVLTEDE